MLRTLVAGIALTGSACTSLQRVEPAHFIPQNKPASVLVTTADSDITNVVGPRIDGDTLRGRVAGLDESVAIPLRDIVSVAAVAPDHRKTAILMAGGAIVGGAVAYWITQQGNGASAPGTAPPLCTDADIDSCLTP